MSLSFDKKLMYNDLKSFYLFSHLKINKDLVTRNKGIAIFEFISVQLKHETEITTKL